MVISVETRLAASPAAETGPAPSLQWLLGARRRFRCGRGVTDFDVRDLDRTNRALTVLGHAGDFLHQIDGGLVALAEDGIAAIEAGVGNLGDEELRAVGVGSGVGVGETAGAIELDGGRSLILEFVAGIAGTGAKGVATLNHEFGDHAMENRAVIKRDAGLLGVSDGAGPVFGAVGKTDEILDSDGGYLRKQGAVEVASGGVDDGGGVGLCGAEQGSGDDQDERID